MSVKMFHDAWLKTRLQPYRQLVSIYLCGIYSCVFYTLSILNQVYLILGLVCSLAVVSCASVTAAFSLSHSVTFLVSSCCSDSR
jgi:hypothetical protein